MKADARDRFLTSLPAGEWSEVHVIEEPIGMMAAHAVHATAVRVRDGKRAYLKCILGRGDSAGSTTRQLAGSTRLARVRSRLEAARLAQVPLVEILALEEIFEPSGLLIAMASVTPIHELVCTGVADPTLSARVLSELASAVCGGWIHYDICPRNTACTDDGCCVFIDPESLYCAKDDLIDVSLPAFKFHRTPDQLAMECQDAAFGGSLSEVMAAKKHDAELIVLAAECSLGLFSENFCPLAVERWCAGAPVSEPHRRLWREVLLKLADGEVVDPLALSAQVAVIDRQTQSASTEPVAPSRRANARVDGQVDIDGADGWARLEGARGQLRRDLMDAAELRQYRKKLTELAKQVPHERKYWEELLLVTLAYEKNPTVAIEIAGQALKIFREDTEFVRKQQLARMWVAGEH